MTLIERFAAAFRGHEIDETSQPRREALVDLLVFTMFIDHHLALAEHEKLDELTRDLSWESVTGLPDFFSDSIARARDMLDDDQLTGNYLVEIGQRLGDRESRQRAFAACEQMMSADGKLAPEEARLLRAVTKSFDLR